MAFMSDLISNFPQRPEELTSVHCSLVATSALTLSSSSSLTQQHPEPPLLECFLEELGCIICPLKALPSGNAFTDKRCPFPCA